MKTTSKKETLQKGYSIQSLSPEEAYEHQFIKETIKELGQVLDTLDTLLYHGFHQNQKLKDMCYYLRKIEASELSLYHLFIEKAGVFPGMLKEFLSTASLVKEDKKASITSFCQYLEVKFIIWKTRNPISNE